MNLEENSLNLCRFNSPAQGPKIRLDATQEPSLNYTKRWLVSTNLKASDYELNNLDPNGKEDNSLEESPTASNS